MTTDMTCLELTLTLTRPMSSQTRQRFSLYRVKCRAQFDVLSDSVCFWISLSVRYLLADF
jgi:hypothetical protein